MTKRIHDIMKDHPFFAGIDPETLEFICGCGSNVRFGEGAYLCRDGEEATAFFALREGRAAVQVQAPGRGVVTVATVRAGDILGWSWLFPPYRWLYDAVVLEPVKAVRFDGTCLRRKCEQDPAMGYDLMKRFARVFTKRLEAARLQVLDVYGTVPAIP